MARDVQACIRDGRCDGPAIRIASNHALREIVVGRRSLGVVQPPEQRGFLRESQPLVHVAHHGPVAKVLVNESGDAVLPVEDDELAVLAAAHGHDADRVQVETVGELSDVPGVEFALDAMVGLEVPGGDLFDGARSGVRVRCHRRLSNSMARWMR